MQKDIEQLIYFATKAPSGHNTQPWKFKVDGNRILILPDLDRALPVVDPDNHALFISLGCATENLVIAAAHSGNHADVSIVEGKEPHIEVTLTEMPIPADNPLFAQLAIRQTTRNNYNGASIPATHLEMLQKAAQQEGVQCRIMTREDEIDPVIELVKAGCIRQFKNPDFVHELVHWIRFNKDRAAKKHDGLYSATTGNPNVPEWFGKLYMDLATSAEKQAWKCEEQIRSSSGLVVFIGQRDDIQSWVNVGRSFERFALKATDLGIHHAHENMACEERPVREELAALLGLHNGEQPLLLVRIGYSEKMPYSYRRPVEEVLIAEEASVAL